MTARQTRRAYALNAGDYILDDGVLHLVVFTLDLDHTTLLVFATGWTVVYDHDRPIDLATPEEIAAARAEALKTGRGIRNFPNEPAPVGPVVQEFGPMYAATPEGCRKADAADAALARAGAPLSNRGGCTRGPGCPVHDHGAAERTRMADEAEAALEDGYDGPMPPKPAPDGWAITGGHAVTPPAEALTFDGRYDNGGTDR